MKKIRSWLARHFGNQQIMADMEYTRKVRRKTDQAVEDIRTTLNGEDRFFLKMCDSRDPEEKECPPDYDNSI